MRASAVDPQWRRKRLRELAQINYGRDARPILDPYGTYPVYGTAGSNRYGTSYLYDGDSVVLGRKGSIDRVQFVTGPFWTIDTAYFLSKFSECVPKWLYFVLCGIDLRSLNEATGVPSLSREVLQRLPVLTPPPTEQSKIAEVLSTVDRAIEQTEALITKQQRIKTGLMQGLLTCGIDEHGDLRSEVTHAFKDSPLGRIPVEWDVTTVDQIAKTTTGDKDTQDADSNAEYPFFVRSQSIEKISSYSFDGEAVLTAGDGVGTGKVFHYFNGRFDYHQRVYCMHSFSTDMLGYYFFTYFQSHFMERVAKFSAKGSVDSVRRNMITNMLISKPKPEEQRKTVELLQKSAKLIDDYIITLAKLRSLKNALMQDLLTGKVRVTPLLEPTEEATA